MGETAFAIGSTVRLKSGGPWMTVVGYAYSPNLSIMCAWFLSQGLGGSDVNCYREGFPEDALEFTAKR